MKSKAVGLVPLLGLIGPLAGCEVGGTGEGGKGGEGGTPEPSGQIEAPKVAEAVSSEVSQES